MNDYSSTTRFTYQIRQISKDKALEMIQKYHYSNTLPKLNKYFLGFFLEGQLVGGHHIGMGNQTKTYNPKNISKPGHSRLSGNWKDVHVGTNAKE